MTHLLIPELIDNIFEYLNDRDLYTCLFVNPQFHSHAIRVIYRDISFNAGFTAYYSNEEHKLQVVTYLEENLIIV